MPLNETDRGWIKQAIAEALQNRFKGWKETVRLWSIPSVALAILIFAFTQWEKYVEFRTHAGDRMDSIEQKVKNIEANVLAVARHASVF